MERIERLAQAIKYCGENLCDSACLFYEECQNADRPFSLEDENIKEVQKLVDENRALKTELRANGKDHFRSGTKTVSDQEAKSDSGKPRLTLVPPKIIWDIAAVRQYGVEVKYPVTGVDGWRTIGEERIRDAAARHFLRYLTDPKGVDEESGLRHLWHLATNIAFLCELEGWENDGQIEVIGNNHDNELLEGE